MELSHMLNQMCHLALAQADITAIRKARGFSQKETVSRGTFENFFLSSIGLKAVLASLSAEEVAALHLLSQKQDEQAEVDITFFERVYGSARGNSTYYPGTFSQQYKYTFEEVKKSLVRKGVLLMAETKMRGETVLMERWRFRFPPDFAPFLPPLIQSPRVFDAPGVVKSRVARDKLLDLIGKSELSSSAKAQYPLAIRRGVLMMKGEAFRAETLVEWQQAMWNLELAIAETAGHLLPTCAIQLILATLQPGEWAAPEQLAPPLKVFCFGEKMLDVEKICQVGWKWGCLAQLAADGKTFYRLPAPEVYGEPGIPAAYLQPAPQGEAARVDLRVIPYNDLEHLNGLAHLEVVDQNLIASPDAVRLSRAGLDAFQTPQARWLYENLPAFRQAMHHVTEHWGKTILHSNLLVARVRDLSLRVQLERELQDALVVISDEYVAFPSSWRAEVEKALKKWGFVVKEVSA